MLNLLKYLDARMGEPSTWASIAMMLGMLGVNLDPGVTHTMAVWGAVASAVLGAVLGEVGTKPTSQIANDAMTALVTAIKAMPTKQG